MNNSHNELEQVLRKEIEGEVRFDPYSKVLYSTDASLYQMEPIGVVVPRHKEDVTKTIQIAYDRNLPILPRGRRNQLGRPDGGTSHCHRHVEVYERDHRSQCRRGTGHGCNRGLSLMN